MKKIFAISLFLIPLFFAKGQGWGDADVAYMLYDIDSSHVVADFRAGIKMTPASVFKLITTASAFEMLGPESRITTLVTTDGVVDSQGVLNGNLYVRGALDPTVESEYMTDVAFFRPLIDTLRNSGVRAVNGDIVVDGSIVRREVVPDKWVLEDLATYYGVGCYGISVCDNVQKFSIKTSGEGRSPSFSFSYPESSFRVIDHVRVTKNASNDIHLYTMPYADELLVEGTMRKNSTWSDPLAISDPVLFFSKRLKTRLQEGGITVSGTAREGTAVDSQVIYCHRSPMLFHINSVTNYRSNNHYAQHLFRLLGAKTVNGGATTADAAMAIRDLWLTRGVDLSTVTFCDGNGLSPFDAVTARQIVDILNYMWRSDNGYYFYNTLPQCGKEGTVAKLFTDSPMFIRAKSGSMSGVQSYAGYIVSRGRCYSFCIFVNKFSCSRQQVKSMIEQTITDAVCDYENTL